MEVTQSDSTIHQTIKPSKVNALYDLPDELITTILSKISLRNLVKVRYVSRKFNDSVISVLNSVHQIQINYESIGKLFYGHLQHDRSLYLFDSMRMLTIEFENHPVEQFWLFISNNCKNLQVIDAPETVIKVNDLLALPSSLKYFSFHRILYFRRVNLYAIADKFDNLISFDLTYLKNSMPVDLETEFSKRYNHFIPKLTRDVSFFDSLDQIPSFTKSLQVSPGKTNLISSFPQTITRTLICLSLEIRRANQINWIYSKFPKLRSFKLESTNHGNDPELAKLNWKIVSSFKTSSDLNLLQLNADFDYDHCESLTPLVASWKHLRRLLICVHFFKKRPDEDKTFIVPVSNQVTELEVCCESKFLLEISKTNSLKSIDLLSPLSPSALSGINLIHLVCCSISVNSLDFIISLLNCLMKNKSLKKLDANLVNDKSIKLSNEQLSTFLVNEYFSFDGASELNIEVNQLTREIIIDLLFEFTLPAEHNFSKSGHYGPVEEWNCFPFLTDWKIVEGNRNIQISRFSKTFFSLEHNIKQLVKLINEHSYR